MHNENKEKQNNSEAKKLKAVRLLTPKDSTSSDVEKTDEAVVDVADNTPAASEGKTKETKKKKKYNVKKYVGRFFIALLVVLVMVVYVVYALLSTVANGPSQTIRDQLVLSAMQASATKWVPGLFLPKETVDQIVADSKKVSMETISLDEYSSSNQLYSGVLDSSSKKDPWENAVDGMIFDTVNGSTYKAYVLLVKDPSRVFVGTSSDYTSGKPGMNIFDIAKKYDAVAAINGGEFSDPGGVGTGSTPLGITYSEGKLMWNDGYNNRTFIGLDKNNKLVVSEGMTKARAEELGIRDGVCFQTGNVLITNEGGNVILHKADGNTGTAQRTAIGQTADGTLILLVTDGRTTSSIGATHNDVIDIMVSYGAVTAGMLDGGSSSLMYYEDYYNKYDFDINKLDNYQKQGLVNKYKAFTEPRRIPTYFIVGGEN